MRSLLLRRISPMGFARKHDNQRLPAGAASGGGRSSAMSRRMSAKRFLGMATSAILEGDVATVTDDLSADLDQLIFEARQRPIFDRLWRPERAEEVAEIVGERMEEGGRRWRRRSA